MIVIDTHVWIWWVDNHPKLRPDVKNVLDREIDIRIVSISLLEIATANSLGRLDLRPSADQWLEIAQSIESVHIEPLTASVCLESTRLPGDFHRDPADRLIVAFARQASAPLYTADKRILAYPHVESVDAGI